MHRPNFCAHIIFFLFSSIFHRINIPLKESAAPRCQQQNRTAKKNLGVGKSEEEAQGGNAAVPNVWTIKHTVPKTF